MRGLPAGPLQLQALAGNAAVARLIAGTAGQVGSAAAAGMEATASAAALEASARAAPNREVSSQVPHPSTPPDPRRSADTTDRPSQQLTSTVVQRGILDDVAGGVASIAGGARDSVLQTLAGWARRMPGYELLCTILGRDVVAGTPVPRSAAAIISGFLGLMPRGEELRQQLQQSGAIDRAGAWFEQEVPKLGLTWDLLRGLFSRAWDALSATDLLDPEGAWQRISRIFGPPLARLRDFAVGAVTKVAEFVFEGAMSMAGGLGTQVMGIIRQAGGVFNQILRDPVGFAGNLVAAVRGGLGAFLSNVGTHLRNGLIGWLTGSLGGIIRLPAQFDLRGILGMAMEFLGLTWQNIRTRIAALIGERTLGLLERGAGIVADVARNGISAITARIAQFTSGLVDTVLGGIRDWVTNSVVGAAITRLLSMFNPAGAVIQAIIAVYNTIQFFIERAQQLGALANSVFTSIGAIAAGSIGNAVNSVEQALGRAVPVVLGFLARLIGLGDVATPVRNVMTRVQGVINAAIDRVVGWIAGMARRVTSAANGARAGRPTGEPMTPPARGATNSRTPIDRTFSMSAVAHHLRFQPPDRLVMASWEGDLLSKIDNRLRVAVADRDEVQDLQRIRGAAEELLRIAPNTPQIQIDRRMNAIIRMLATYGADYRQSDLDRSLPAPTSLPESSALQTELRACGVRQDLISRIISNLSISGRSLIAVILGQRLRNVHNYRTVLSQLSTVGGIGAAAMAMNEALRLLDASGSGARIEFERQGYGTSASSRYYDVDLSTVDAAGRMSTAYQMKGIYLNAFPNQLASAARQLANAPARRRAIIIDVIDATSSQFDRHPNSRDALTGFQTRFPDYALRIGFNAGAPKFINWGGLP
ncbi:hypothetical protein [Microbacterium sp. BK668]|uniref:hypothetical protein n=1 Tax=Microbacterium sp. BK668 TaxID=2512118 RepID=UPI00105C79F8|nr:hypothetical protein [Microbacterium sp. BK668]TDN87738.1 hypothetical protein EV279_3169 [Microbacterium sp. BK668]